MTELAIIANRKQEARKMEDDLIFVLSLNILGLFLIDYFNQHVFGVECVWAVINTVVTMYYFYKHKGKQ